MKSFDDKLYICETYHKHLNKNEVFSQTVSNKAALDPYELKKLKKLEKFLIFKIMLFKKITIMHKKVNFPKLRKAFLQYSNRN